MCPLEGRLQRTPMRPNASEFRNCNAVLLTRCLACSFFPGSQLTTSRGASSSFKGALITAAPAAARTRRFSTVRLDPANKLPNHSIQTQARSHRVLC